MTTEAEEKSISYSNCLPVICSGTNGAVEGEAIQKFLSVCLDQFFNRSGDRQNSFVAEMFKVCLEPVYLSCEELLSIKLIAVATYKNFRSELVLQCVVLFCYWNWLHSRS